MKKLMALMAIAGASVCFADATEPPSNLYDLTTSDAGSVFRASSQYNNGFSGAKAFDGSVSGDGNRWLSGEASSWWIIYKFNVSTVVDSISIALPAEGQGASQAARAPKDWTFEAWNDNSTVTNVLHTQTGESGWSDGEKRYYKFETPNTKAYQYYKFNCTANNGDTRLQIGEFEFYCVGTGDSTWTGGGETGLVNDDANWGGAAMPGSECVANIDNTGDTPATIPAGPTFWKVLSVGAGSGNNAKVVQEMGTVAVVRDFYVGYNSGACGEYKMSGGRCTTGTSVFVGYGAAQGLFEMTGGTLSATSSLSIGRFGHGTFSASGDGTVVTAADVRVGFTHKSGNGYGTFIVTNGAEVATKKIYAGAGKSHVDRAKVVFDGAVLTATAASAEFLKDLPDVTLGAGGLTINTEGNAVTIANCAFVAEPGAKITVTGGGTVTFADCTVAFTEKPGRSFAFAETDGVFSGMPAFSNIGGSTVVMSGDNKKISIVRHGLMIIFQ